MKYSLLYKNNSTEHKPNTDYDKIFYDLNIDKAVMSFCPHPTKAGYFLEILKTPLECIDDALFRQDILRDFLNNNNLLNSMKLIFNRYDSIKNDWNELKHNAYPAEASGNNKVLLDYTYSNIQTTSTFTRTIVSYLRSFYELLEGSELSSEGLINIRSYCKRMIENKSLDEIYRIASLFQYHTPDQFRFSVSVNYDDSLRIIESSLTEIVNKEDIKKDSLLKKLFVKKHESGILFMGDTESDEALFVLNEALLQLSETLSEITAAIYDLFYGVSREFMFYETAVLYHEFLDSNNIYHQFPSLLNANDDCFYAKELKDLVLCSDDSCDTVVANDVSFSSKDHGMIIIGRNNTGKTVFLRSIAIAQLFAQSGLPVCAKEARMSIRTLICAHFSSAEDDLKEGDAAGRFEGEVAQLSKIIDCIKPHSLVFFNETFQTTSYEEGTSAIETILSLLSAIKVQYIFVTHLTGLIEKADNEVIILETDFEKSKYKLRKRDK